MKRGINKRLASRWHTKILETVAVAILMACVMTPAAASEPNYCTGPGLGNNLVQNASFETGDFTNWTVAWPFSADQFFFVSPSNPFPGDTYDAWLGSVPGENRISQVIQGTQQGMVYTVCFELANDDACCANSIEVHWNDYTLLHFVNSTGFGYTYFTFNVVANGANSDTLVFQVRQVPAFYHLDNVSVQLCTDPSCSFSFTPARPAGTKPKH